MSVLATALALTCAVSAAPRQVEVELHSPPPWTLRLDRYEKVVAVEVLAADGTPKGAKLRLSFSGVGSIEMTLPPSGWAYRRVPRVGAASLSIEPVGEMPRPGKVRIRYARDLVWPERDKAAAVETIELPDWHAPDLPAINLRAGMHTCYFEHGFADAFASAQGLRLLGDALRRLNCTALRFPGGSFAYGYAPLDRRCLAIYSAAKLGNVNYSLWDPDKWGWVSAREFFRFCADNGLVAWYQIDPGFLCDPEEGKAYQIASFDGRGKDMLPVAPEGRLRAAAVAERLARLAHAAGAKVVWEIGNEDYCYYSAATYAGLVKLFADAVRRVDPSAKIAACGDSKSWSDLKWQAEVGRLLSQQGLPDYWSVHLYLQGVWMEVGGKWTPRPWDTQDDVMAQTVGAWDNIAGGMYRHQYREHLWSHGRHAPFILTEFNVFTPGATEAKMGHSFGRALGEAAIYPGLAGLDEDDPATEGVFPHDLVRSGGEQNWFQRLDYYPELTPPYRYGFQCDAMSWSLVSRHALGTMVVRRAADDVYIAASDVRDGQYVTAVNLSGKAVALRIVGSAKSMGIATLMADGDRDYDYGLAQKRVAPKVEAQDRRSWTVVSPPHSIVAVMIPRG